MHEIKFRALGLDGKLHYFSLASDFGNRDEDCGVFYVDGIPLKIGTEQQFTGIEDKDGKEIYKGDRIRFYTGRIAYPPPKGRKIYEEALVIFEDGMFQLEGHLPFTNRSVTELKVIGRG